MDLRVVVFILMGSLLVFLVSLSIFSGNYKLILKPFRKNIKDENLILCCRSIGKTIFILFFGLLISLFLIIKIDNIAYVITGYIILGLSALITLVISVLILIKYNKL